MQKAKVSIYTTANAGFSNVTTPADTSPFTSGQTIRYQTQTALTNGLTYWWRVRARDPAGSNSWSNYSTPKSFTVDTSVTTSVWHQTIGEQFATDENVDIETVAGGAQVTSVINGVMVSLPKFFNISSFRHLQITPLCDCRNFKKRF